MLMKEYIIKITGEYEMLVLSPQMISLLIEKIEMSDSKELVISAEEILPQGYIEYLAHVLSANFEIDQSKTDIRAAYDMVAEQIDKLKIDTKKCIPHMMKYLTDKGYKIEIDFSGSQMIWGQIKNNLSLFIL